VAPIEITTEHQPPGGRFVIPDSGQTAWSQLTNSVQQCLL